MAASDHLSGYQFSDVTLPHDGAQGDIHVSDGHEIVGQLQWQHTIGPTITSVSVDPDHQRRGIATEMYRRASEAAGAPLGHDQQRTDAGDSWARSVGGKLPSRIRAAE